MEVAVGAAALVFLVALGAVMLLRRSRRQESGVVSREVQALPPEPLESGGIAKTFLIPVPNRPNEMVAVGSSEGLDLLEASGVAHRSASSRSLLPGVIRSLLSGGGVEANRRFSKGVREGRIVEIAPKTVELMKKNKQMYDSSGQALGLLRGKDGIAHVMRFRQHGAKAVSASNMATLAMTVALSHQLGEIEKKLEEMQRALDQLLDRDDRSRIASISATNQDLAAVARAIERRGLMTEADWDRVASLSNTVTKNAIEAQIHLDKTPEGEPMSRRQRSKKLASLVEDERLEYWLAMRVESELAVTRRDLLYLYWEQMNHPESAEQLAEEVRKDIRSRQDELLKLGNTLDDLADPESRTFKDHFQQISRRKLVKRDRVIAEILERHGDVFMGSTADPSRIAEKSARDGDVLILEAEGAGKS